MDAEKFSSIRLKVPVSLVVDLVAAQAWRDGDVPGSYSLDGFDIDAEFFYLTFVKPEPVEEVPGWRPERDPKLDPDATGKDS